MTCRLGRMGALIALTLLAACAPKALPTAPAAPKFPEFVFPATPDDSDRGTVEAQRFAWRLLQIGDLRGADREFARILRRRPGYAPAETGLGYAALARKQAAAALEHFDRALAQGASYAPALVGRAQALLSLERTAEALASYEAAAEADPTLELGPRIELLRFRGAQDTVEDARSAARRGDLDTARASYLQALAASPESAFLHRELGLVEAKAGRLDAALEHLRRAATLDPSDARSHGHVGDLLAERGDLAGAIASYEASLAIEHSAEVAARLETVARRAEAASLPPEYQAIAGAAEVTRGDLAALVGVRLADWMRAGQVRGTVLMTDTRGHWAAPWILPVAQAGVMDVYPNHTFQPGTRIRRSDLAQALSRVVALVAARKPGFGASWRERQTIADVPPTHPSHPAVAQAVAAGLMQLSPDGTFQPARPATGPEVIAAIDRLVRLAGPAPGAPRRPR